MSNIWPIELCHLTFRDPGGVGNSEIGQMTAVLPPVAP